MRVCECVCVCVGGGGGGGGGKGALLLKKKMFPREVNFFPVRVYLFILFLQSGLLL